MLVKNIGLQVDELVNLISIFERIPSISEVVLFGSRALGTYRIGSDIDLALKGNITHTEWFDVQIAIDELDFPYKFDVVLFNKISNLELIAHIERVGKGLHTKPISK